MKKVNVTAESRTAHGSALCRKLRYGGVVPAVVYGRKIQPQALQIKAEDVAGMIKQGQRMVDLTTPAGTQKVFIREVQYDATGDRVLHIDFNQVPMDEELSLEVVMEITGKPVGVTAEGGVLSQFVKMIPVRCLPDAIPDKLTADVSALKLNDNLLVRDLKAPKGVTIAAAPELVVAGVRPPMIEETAAAAAAEPGPAEPEVIGKKPAEGEEAAAAGDEKPAKPAKAEKGGEEKDAEKKK
jgi:large subunit ribosomal protein L25